MRLIHKNILLISPESWDHIFVSKHHYAVHLAARKNRVFFLNPPAGTKKVESTEFEDVWSVNYDGFPKGMRFYPRFIQRLFTRLKFNELQKLCGLHFDIIWSFDNSVFFNFDALEDDVKKICHIVDLNQDFETKRAAESADICLCTTNQIRERLLNFNNNVFKINHGFNTLYKTKASHVYSLPGTRKIKVIYAGNLAIKYLDWINLYNVALENTDADFIFIGPDKTGYLDEQNQNSAKNNIFGLKNVFRLGFVDASDLVIYQQQADILLVSYQMKYADQVSNPHKIMEYLGTGKAILATYTMEYSNLEEGLIIMCNPDQSYAELFKSLKMDLARLNNEEAQNKRREYALDNSYERQIERIETLLE